MEAAPLWTPNPPRDSSGHLPPSTGRCHLAAWKWHLRDQADLTQRVFPNSRRVCGFTHTRPLAHGVGGPGRVSRIGSLVMQHACKSKLPSAHRFRLSQASGNRTVLSFKATSGGTCLWKQDGSLIQSNLRGHLFVEIGRFSCAGQPRGGTCLGRSCLLGLPHLSLRGITINAG